MKLTKDELINSIADAPIDDDVKMTLLENVSDSIDGGSQVDLSNYVEKSAYDELKAKYIQRFSEGTPEQKPEPKPEPEDDDDVVTYESLFEEV